MTAGQHMSIVPVHREDVCDIRIPAFAFTDYAQPEFFQRSERVPHLYHHKRSALPERAHAYAVRVEHNDL